MLKFKSEYGPNILRQEVVILKYFLSIYCPGPFTERQHCTFGGRSGLRSLWVHKHRRWELHGMFLDGGSETAGDHHSRVQLEFRNCHHWVGQSGEEKQDRCKFLPTCMLVFVCINSISFSILCIYYQDPHRIMFCAEYGHGVEGDGENSWVHSWGNAPPPSKVSLWFFIHSIFTCMYLLFALILLGERMFYLFVQVNQ